MIGTVSPAGGNFEEPVTQSTLGTVKTFLGLSYDRAYKRFYPAIDPLLSWSRYREQLQDYLDRNLDTGWTESVEALLTLLRQADAIYQMMQVTGEEGISLDDFVTYQKAQFLDTVYLQQDAFDPVDVATPMDRQQTMLSLVKDVTQREFLFDDKDKARDFFIRITSAFRNLNYSATGSSDYEKFLTSIRSMLSDR
jgi:V/A-type H+-transporting ATPase subunit A